MKKDEYPLIDNKELLEPIVIVMPKGKRHPQPMDALIYTQREFDYLLRLQGPGIDVNVKPNPNLQ